MSTDPASLSDCPTYDDRDTMSADAREQAIFERLPAHLTDAVARCPGLADHLEGCDLSAVNTRSALSTLPVLRKSALMAAQQQYPPFGGFADESALQGCRVFQSPGPVWEPQVSGTDPFACARALHAAGFRPGDIVHNTFSYHQTPGGFILDEGARALGCIVYPAGVGQTDAQVAALVHMAASAFVGTPDYLKTVLDHAQANQEPLPALKRALVSGGPLFPAMRQAWAEAGIHVQQCYATADLGVIAYESATDGQVHDGMLVNENLIVEIVRPGSGESVAAGEVGEILVTRLHADYPLLRFATGDLSALIDTPSPCGRTADRLRGWLGRADQRTKVRGQFVDPLQLESIRQAHPELADLRLRVERESDRDNLVLEVRAWDEQPVAVNALTDTLKRVTGLSGEVSLTDTPWVADGLVIVDNRPLPD